MNPLKRFSPATFVTVLAVYLFYTGSVGEYDLITGSMIALIVSFLAGHWLVKDDLKFFSPRRWFYAIIYGLRYFLIEETKAHIDVAKRVFTLKANPGIVRIPLEVENDYGKVFVANSITNTPGTVVVDISDDGKWLYVHWIDVSTLDEGEVKEKVVSYFEDYAKKIFN
ncbi:Na+/H+ antiporter subunit E [Thermococcus waiotapuensis]|uniref:Na+/H+ antiporter subunit E n=1 Tax=Thermococcus waiotapuensis TaxID=90909 RepID=A0AAE4NU33_9EURY|nr:Na+/H+ antiporter subunit E [Thermococcus waiotapuensis]MDV3103874.1 Na+/H+ antiporter subunit E [Thermococcus waiotapuensis]